MANQNSWTLPTDTASEDVAVVFLARGIGGGREAAQTFFDSYRAHSSGWPHRLVVLAKGWECETGLEDVAHWTRMLGGELLMLPDDGFDLGAYFRAVALIDQPWLCFLNTHSRILADGWLKLLRIAAEQPGVGASGATGSWESSLCNVRRSGRTLSERCRPRYLMRVAYNAIRYPGFPNPHLRSNAFLIRRVTFAQFAGARRIPSHKRDAQALESGRSGLTTFLRSRGLDVVVVGANGSVFMAPQWPYSGTFRVPGHPNLLVEDNQTRGFDNADEHTRYQLQLAAWGRAIA